MCELTEPYKNIPPQTEIKTPKVYTPIEQICSFICIILGYFWLDTVLLHGGRSTGGALFCIALSITAFFAMKKIGAAMTRFVIFLFAMSLLFGGNLFITSNEYAKFASGFSSVTATAMFLWCTSCGYSKPQPYMGLDLMNAVLKRPFESYSETLPAAVSVTRKIKGNNLKNVKYIVLGLLFALPATAVITVLLSMADERMESLMDSIFDFEFIPSEMVSHIITFVFSLLISCGIFSLIFSAIRTKRTPDEANFLKSTFAETCGKANGLLVYSAVTPICLIYVIFFFLQADYFLGGFMGNLPDGQSFSEYARRGFFELCAVAVINAAIILFINGICEKQSGRPKALKFFTIFLSASTVLLVATAMSKMVMYINEYGYTQKRIYASILMISLAILFIFVIVKQVWEQFDLSMTAFVLTVTMLSVFSFANVDSFIVNENYRLYTSGKISEFGVSYYDISADAIPALDRLAKDNFKKAQNIIKDKGEVLELDHKHGSIYQANLREYVGRMIAGEYRS
ncbi:MAG: DUF4173 domain-containing protein [Oscillospiraceae bacterium]|nr:DUF4173 domain-containing protein [Oscillospiraceae bacterium]